MSPALIEAQAAGANLLLTPHAAFYSDEVRRFSDALPASITTGIATGSELPHSPPPDPAFSSPRHFGSASTQPADRTRWLGLPPWLPAQWHPPQRAHGRPRLVPRGRLLRRCVTWRRARSDASSAARRPSIRSTEGRVECWVGRGERCRAPIRPVLLFVVAYLP